MFNFDAGFYCIVSWSVYVGEQLKLVSILAALYGQVHVVVQCTSKYGVYKMDSEEKIFLLEHFYLIAMFLCTVTCKNRHVDL